MPSTVVIGVVLTGAIITLLSIFGVGRTRTPPFAVVPTTLAAHELAAKDFRARKKSSTWVLRWHDEFSGTSLSRRNWRVLNQSTYGDANQQLECEEAANATVHRGILTIAAKRQHVQCGTHDARFSGGRDYTSATIDTKGTASWKYGRFEIRAELPIAVGSSQSMWPAFWLRPADGGKGEIDVLEALGSSGAGDTVHTTIHPDYAGPLQTQTHAAHFAPNSLSRKFHTYAVDWEPKSITWYVDGEKIWSRTTTTTPWLSGTFARNFILRLNLAVGGRWPGSPNAATVFPQHYDIDWVRVYQHRVTVKR